MFLEPLFKHREHPDEDAVVLRVLLAVQMREKDEVTTVEGLSKPGEPSVIQEAFLEKYGFQCGFCTPGMILTTKALLDTKPKPTVEEIKDQFEGNLCRCTG